MIVYEIDMPIEQELILMLVLLILLLWLIRPRRSSQQSHSEAERPQAVESTSQTLNPEYGRYIQLGMRGAE